MGVRMLRGCQTSRGSTCPEDLSTYSGHLHKRQPVNSPGGAHPPAGSGRAPGHTEQECRLGTGALPREQPEALNSIQRHPGQSQPINIR